MTVSTLVNGTAAMCAAALVSMTGVAFLLRAISRLFHLGEGRL